MTIAPELLRRIVEGALLAAAQPLSEDRLLALIEEGERPEKAALREALEQIAENCAERGFELKQVASGWRFQVPEDLAPWVNKLWEEKPQKYSRATLETLAIIAYRQPITRGDIEEIRGVAVSSHIVKSLSERGWIKVVGQRDVPGKPSLYATTREFLDYFNLKSLEELPTLAEIRDIESLNAALDLGEGNTPAGADADPEQAAGESAEGENADPDAAEKDDFEAPEAEGEAVAEADGSDPDEQSDTEVDSAQQAAAEDYAEDAESPQAEPAEQEPIAQVSIEHDVTDQDASLSEESGDAALSDSVDELDEAPEAQELPEQEAVSEDENKSPENLNS
ncbi:SMC-Scp complex subunit ScpB [Microbulbifer hydrolyticus]|uniref:SMC-Scp complex subunit ScpB n=1 Tax=Microbulbifer hydrolyticus TaxID=48074 RepID=A0A6P1TCL2_9GAMM|nr:SMC-Scp complex subunit ScpB [Microbulbifer hydrolyticus]MBB5209922.1 segregation and condensation protein B [Microbulbifer hydrolyticus]QHQ39541.1 SMC-Scp complex subunit ScpB [Microbulbifer hydrolyticus]